MAENLGLEVFDNPDFGTIRVLDEDGKYLFCGLDVAKALGYVNLRDALNRHCKGGVKRDTLTKGGVQEMIFIPEGDVYRLDSHSHLPSAEKFERWVFDTVLPSIRKTGGYIAGEEHQKGNIMPKNLSPPAVHHQGRPKHSLQYQESMLRDAAAHVRLSPSAAALLVYYGTQAERFRPSLKLIERKTGISANKVSEKRKELVDHGLIFYVPGIMVAIRWEVIRIFALMLP